MRLLICAIEAPLPPPNGFRLLISALLRELRKRHDVRLLGYRLPDQQEEPDDSSCVRLLARPEPGAVADAATLIRALVRRRPLRADQLAAALSGPLADELERFKPDVVHVSSGRLAGLGAALEGRPSVLGALDAWHLNTQARALAASGLRRRLLEGECVRVRRFEAAEYRRFGQIIVVSEQDREALKEVNSELPITVIPNGVDADYFAPDTGTAVAPGRIVFTGVMSYAPNVTAAEFLARRVFPHVKQARPDARLVIVGRSPSARVRELGNLGGIEVTGEVPDLRPWLRSANAYICPMVSGTGIKNKLLEAMATGLPCVATPLALQGMTATPGQHVLVGTSAEELADHLLRLVANADLAQAYGAAAREYVSSAHSWPTVAREYERVFRGAMDCRPTLTEADSA